MIGIVIVGVGGQGTLLASRILGQLAIAKGYDVKVSEVHGMSQRGGSVITHVRIDQQAVASPLVEQGGADAVLALEKLEALRALPYLKKDGLMVINEQEILPMPVIIGAAQYPSDAISQVQAVANVRIVDALMMAAGLGTPKAANVVLLGVLAHALPFSIQEWEAALRLCVPEKFLQINLAAFHAGYQA